MENEALIKIYVVVFILIFVLRMAWPFLTRNDKRDYDDQTNFTEEQDKSMESLRNILEVQNTLAVENEKNKKILSEKEKDNLLKPANYERLSKEFKDDYWETENANKQKKAIKSISNAAMKDQIEDFTHRLKNVDDEAIGSLLVGATMVRLNLEQHDNIPAHVLTDGAARNSRLCFDLGFMLATRIEALKGENSSLVSYLMVWCHSIRALGDETLVPYGRLMWIELSRGFDHLDHGYEMIKLRTADDLGLEVDLRAKTEAKFVPNGLEAQPLKFDSVETANKIAGILRIQRDWGLDALDEMNLGVWEKSKFEARLEDDFSIGYIGGFCDGCLQRELGDDLEKYETECLAIFTIVYISLFGDEKGAEICNKFFELQDAPNKMFNQGRAKGGNTAFSIWKKRSDLSQSNDWTDYISSN